MTERLITDQTEITGLTTIDWQQPMWRERTSSTATSSIGKLLIPTDKCPDRKSARSSTGPHFEVCMPEFRISVNGHYTAQHCISEHVSQGINKLFHQQNQRVCGDTWHALVACSVCELRSFRTMLPCAMCARHFCIRLYLADASR